MCLVPFLFFNWCLLYFSVHIMMLFLSFCLSLLAYFGSSFVSFIRNLWKSTYAACIFCAFGQAMQYLIVYYAHISPFFFVVFALQYLKLFRFYTNIVQEPHIFFRLWYGFVSDSEHSVPVPTYFLILPSFCLYLCSNTCRFTI